MYKVNQDKVLMTDQLKTLDIFTLMLEIHKKVSGYDREVPQLHNADQPMAP